MLKKKAELLVTDESLDNELQDNKNILTNLSSHEVQNQVNLLIFYSNKHCCKVFKIIKINFNEYPV